jgi:hypothetical protein
MTYSFDNTKCQDATHRHIKGGQVFKRSGPLGADHALIWVNDKWEVAYSSTNADLVCNEKYDFLHHD